MERKWWHGKVAYQVYPKSFLDTNGDGIGDLQGIISKLDYLKDLGVDIVWISPVYCSPFVDQGYDISDYYNIDPCFGTMEDMDELLAEAKKRDMAVLMDLVVNHCSNEHEWFQKALADPDGEYGQYFYIREGKNGQPPCNWRSYFGGSAWEPIPGTNKYYLHLFAKEQPDLNWENPKLREEIYKMMNWWLDKGLAGFRIDAIINIKKDLRFQDFPADRADGLCSCATMLAAAEGPGAFLREMKERTFDRVDAFTVGELFNYREEDLPRYIGENGYFSTIFDFSSEAAGCSEKGWYDRRKLSPDEYRDILYRVQRITANVGFMANIIENHDEPRGVSRYLPDGGCTEKSKKMLAAVLMMLRGLPFIYQGQEIGMENGAFKNIEEMDDLNSRDEYRVALAAGCTEEQAMAAVQRYSRDNCRTPFQWNAGTEAGFTTGTPWLKVNPNYTRINAEAQMGNPNSVRSWYRQLIALRKSETYGETVVYGAFRALFEEEHDLIAFAREREGQRLVVLANFREEPRTLQLEAPVKEILLTNRAYTEEEQAQAAEGVITLDGYQVIIAECQ